MPRPRPRRSGTGRRLCPRDRSSRSARRRTVTPRFVAAVRGGTEAPRLSSDGPHELDRAEEHGRDRPPGGRQSEVGLAGEGFEPSKLSTTELQSVPLTAPDVLEYPSVRGRCRAFAAAGFRSGRWPGLPLAPTSRKPLIGKPISDGRETGCRVQTGTDARRSGSRRPSQRFPRRSAGHRGG